MPKWKPISLEGDALANGVEGLIGIEELIDYETFSKGDETIIKKVSKKRKRNQKQNDKTFNKHKKVKLEKVNENPKLFEKMKSWFKFGIERELIQALFEKEFFQPTEIQSLCIRPALLGKRDVLGAAETGSGKTLAFGIPIVSGILKLKEKHLMKDNADEEIDDDRPEDGGSDEEDWEDPEVHHGCVKVLNLKTKKEPNMLYALILTPTRELAVQVKEHLTDLCKYTSIKIALLVGGLAQEKQERLLNKRPEIVVATPGRLWELITTGHTHLKNIEKIKYLAIDETDRMLEKGHFDELGQLLERINCNEEMKSRRQNFVFSATLTLVHEPPSYLKGKNKKRVTPGQKLNDLMNRVGITNPKVVDITSSQVTAENLLEYKIVCKFEEKDYYIYHFLSSHSGRVIIFCNSIGCVKRLANLLNILNYKPLPLHANMEQKQRLKNLEKFRSTVSGLLLATDVAARGLDIPNVDHVVHYQVPKTAESYIHRSGRTARGRNTGDALLLIEPKEHRAYTKLIQTLGREKDIDDLELQTDTMHHIKKVVNLAREIDSLSLALRKDNSKQGWFKKAMDDMDLYLEEDELPKAVSTEAGINMKRDLSIKQKQLKFLLDQPVLPKKFSGKFPDFNISKYEPVNNVRRDKLKIPGAFVLKKVPEVS